MVNEYTGKYFLPRETFRPTTNRRNERLLVQCATASQKNPGGKQPGEKGGKGGKKGKGEQGEQGTKTTAIGWGVSGQQQQGVTLRHLTMASLKSCSRTVPVFSRSVTANICDQSTWLTFAR